MHDIKKKYESEKEDNEEFQGQQHHFSVDGKYEVVFKESNKVYRPSIVFEHLI